MGKELALMALGALALIVGVGFGGLAGDLQNDQTATYYQDEGQTDYPTDRLTIVVESVEPTATPQNVTYEMIDTQTSQRLTQTVDEGNTTSFALQDDVNVTAASIDNGEVQTRVATPRTYGWSDQATTIATNIPFLMLLAGGFSILGGMMAVGVKQ